MEEDEDRLEWRNTQVRYANGFQATDSSVHWYDGEVLYCKDFSFEQPPVKRQVIGTVWTPDQYTAYSMGHTHHRRPLSGRNR